ncbi:hypothetical protein ACOMHN_033933 [Nucella lapillus]
MVPYYGHVPSLLEWCPTTATWFPYSNSALLTTATCFPYWNGALLTTATCLPYWNGALLRPRAFPTGMVPYYGHVVSLLEQCTTNYRHVLSLLEWCPTNHGHVPSLLEWCPTNHGHVPSLRRTARFSSTAAHSAPN